MTEFNELSELQENILFSKQPVQFIQAAAAAGKTRLLCEKVRQSINRGKVTVAFTFTNMAAEEMRQRLGVENNNQIFIGTIHAYCAKLLAVRRVKEARAAIEKEQFDKLFPLAQKYIAPNPPVIDICLCDEAQDSNLAQLKFMFDILHAREYFIMYDTRQSIYRWAGAQPSLLEDYAKKLNATKFSLNENYRNHSEILDFARTLLDGNTPNDDSISMRGEGGRVKFLSYSPETVLTYVRSAGDWRDWAILARTNSQVELISEVLAKAKIPYDTFKQGDLTKEQLTKKMEANTVKVLTVHAAKGLEWRFCIATGMRASDIEECCIAYVAATRAKDGLVWMSAPRKAYQKKKKTYAFDDSDLMKW